MWVCYLLLVCSLFCLCLCWDVCCVTLLLLITIVVGLLVGEMWFGLGFAVQVDGWLGFVVGLFSWFVLVFCLLQGWWVCLVWVCCGFCCFGLVCCGGLLVCYFGVWVGWLFWLVGL